MKQQALIRGIFSHKSAAMNMRKTIYALGLALLMAACNNDEDFVVPSFLHVDAIKLVPTTTDPISTEEGFYTSDIVSCFVEAYFPGSNRVEMLGLYELPFTIPILHSGEVEYFVFSPAIKISGVSGTQTHYSFYRRDTVSNQTLRSGDTLHLDTLTTSYKISLNNVRIFEPFEPTEASILLDSVVWHRHTRDSAYAACSGDGYASVFVPDTVLAVPFSLRNTINVSDPTSAVYLELDTYSDIQFEVYMESQYTTNGSTDIQRVMMVNPTDHWQHMYINLGRTWEWFNYQSPFKLHFRAINANGKGGYVRLDNVKVVYTNQIL